MSKHNVLTKAEFEAYQLSAVVVKLIDDYVKRTGLSRSEVKVLDFGCGRGRTVLKLKLSGMDAYGVDVDDQPVTNASDLFNSYGFDASKCLSIIGHNCEVSFPDNYFDIVLSQQVVEHVRNVDLFFREIARITKPGGLSYHVFPSKYHFTEQHLFMPMIHWLPKNILRKGAIFCWILAGRDPGWEEVRFASVFKRAEGYYSYSVEKTFYRSNRFHKTLLARLGFDVTVRSIRHKRRRGNLNTYFAHTTELFARKLD